MTISAETQAAMDARSVSERTMFDEYTRQNGLDYDLDTWPDLAKQEFAGMQREHSKKWRATIAATKNA